MRVTNPPCVSHAESTSKRCEMPPTTRFSSINRHGPVRIAPPCRESIHPNAIENLEYGSAATLIGFGHFGVTQ